MNADDGDIANDLPRVSVEELSRCYTHTHTHTLMHFELILSVSFAHVDLAC